MTKSDQPKGSLVVIDGIDGAGKATQCKLLSSHLASAGYHVLELQFPRYDRESSYFLREYLQGHYGQTADVGPYAASLFYALDRYEAAFQIREALDQGKVVVCDRFTAANLIHQGAKLDSNIELLRYITWIDNLEYQVLHIPRPTITFILDVPFDAIKKRLVHKKASSISIFKDIHEMDLEHLRRAREVAISLCQLLPDSYAMVGSVQGGALLPAQAIHDRLWRQLAPQLPQTLN